MRAVRAFFPMAVLMAVVAAGFACHESVGGRAAGPPCDDVSAVETENESIELQWRLEAKREIVRDVIDRGMGLLEAVRRVQAVHDGDTTFLNAVRLLPPDYGPYPNAAAATDGELYARNVILYVACDPALSPARAEVVLARLRAELVALLADGTFGKAGWESVLPTPAEKMVKR